LEICPPEGKCPPLPSRQHPSGSYYEKMSFIGWWWGLERAPKIILRGPEIVLVQASKSLSTPLSTLATFFPKQT